MFLRFEISVVHTNLEKIFCTGSKLVWPTLNNTIKFIVATDRQTNANTEHAGALISISVSASAFTTRKESR